MNQLEYDIANFIIFNPEYFTEDLKDLIHKQVIPCLDFKDQFNEQYKLNLLMHIKQYLCDILNLHYEEVSVIVTKEFIEHLLGKDYFIYEHSN